MIYGIFVHEFCILGCIDNIGIIRKVLESNGAVVSNLSFAGRSFFGRDQYDTVTGLYTIDSCSSVFQDGDTFNFIWIDLESGLFYPIDEDQRFTKAADIHG